MAKEGKGARMTSAILARTVQESPQGEITGAALPRVAILAYASFREP